MSTYTSSLGLEEITPGDQAGLWGNTTNNNLALIDQAITGVTPINLAGASSTVVTLTDLDGSISSQSRSAVLNITGIATGSNTVVVPNKQKTYLVRNNTGQNVVFRTASPTASYTVEAGNSILIFCDGNNSVFTGIASPSVGTLGVAGGGTGATTFTAGFVKSTGGTNALTSSSAVNLASEVTGALPVSNGGTGLSTLTSGAILRGAGTSSPALVSGPAGIPGQVLTWNGSQWEGQNPATGAVSSVFGRSGAVTAQSGDYSSFYYPLSSNPSGYVTNSALSGYAQLNVSQTWAGTQTATGTSVGDQKWRVQQGGSTGGLSATSLQLGNSGVGMVYDTGNGGLSMGIIFGVNITCFPSFLYVNTDNTQRPTGGPWVSPSDERLKENIQTYTKGLSAITALRPVIYTLKGELGEATKHKTCTGLIAQEVLETPLSSMIGTNPDGFYSLDANEVTWALVNAVKELKAELDEAKAEIAALKAQ